MHRLLERQIKRTLGLGAEQWPPVLARLQAHAHQLVQGDAELSQVMQGLPMLLDRIADTYAQQDRDVALIRRSLELSSEELITANQRLRDDAEASSRALSALQKAFDVTRSDAATSDDDEDLVAMAEQVAALTREQERMRQILAQSEERFDLAMRGSNDGLWDFDITNNTVFYSPRWITMLGEAENDVGHSVDEWRNRLHPLDVERALQALDRHLSGADAHFEVAYRFRHRKGHYLWILSRGLAVRNREGQPTRIVGTHSDISERMELERHLAQFKAAIDEHAIVSIANVRGQITYANKKFCDISGFSEAELLGRDHSITKSGEHPAEFYARMWQTLRAGHTWTGEICNRARDGRLYWLLSTIAPMLDENGQPYQFIGIRADITANKLHEIELRQAKEDAESASKTKSEFLANMSHEIRTPMNGVLGMLGLALDTPLNEEQHEYLDLAHSSANALLAILNDILDFSKIEAGRLDVHIEPMRPRELVAELGRLNEPRCREKNIGFSVKLDPNLPDWIMADPVRVRQVLLNLLSNALKFTTQGEISLEIKREAHSENGHLREHVRFLVRDSGIGIPEEKQAAVFEAFTQADGSITKRFGGTGLGLTISNHLVKLMGGRMGLHSELNRGSEFFFTLPLMDSPSANAQKPSNASQATDNVATTAPDRLHILLAEDNAINQKLAVSLLGREGYQVTVVENGEAAVKAVTEGAFDLVLMDMHMPGMDGLEATRHIRALPRPDGEVPIVALTANAYAEDRENCLSAGMNGYVVKPIRREELLSAIQQAMEESA
jgi:PAS domain S-box-containing protein